MGVLVSVGQTARQIPPTKDIDAWLELRSADLDGQAGTKLRQKDR